VRSYLDRLIEDYNRQIRLSSKYEPFTIERAYSEEKKSEEVEDFFKSLAKKIEEWNKTLQQANAQVAGSVEKAADIGEKIENAYRTALKVRHMSRNRIVSPIMYRKIMSYYKRHKKQRYYSKYKIDNDLHSFIMRLGSYLESLDKDIDRETDSDFSSDYHYYAGPSLRILFGGGIKEVLGYFSSAIVSIAHMMEVAVHVLVEVSPKALHAIPILPPFLPHFLAGVLAAYSTCGILIIVGYALHPERKSKFKRLIDKIKINLGIRKSYIQAAYLTYVYKLYDILSTISSYVIELGKRIELDKEIDEEKTAEKLEKKAEKSAHVVGLKDKALGYLGDKMKFGIFKIAKDKIETLDETVVIDLESHKKLLNSIKEGNDKLDIFRYKFAVSTDAMQKLADYYGDKFQGGGEWIEVTVQYTGGAYYKAANPLKKIDIPGFSGDSKEAAEFIGAVLALSDKLIVDRVGEQEFESPLVTIDLQNLKLLSCKSKSFIDFLAAPIKVLIRWVIKLIKRKAQEKGKLDPADLSNLMFEAYVNIKGIKPIGTKEKEVQAEEKKEGVAKAEEEEEEIAKAEEGEEEITKTEEEEEEVDETKEQQQKKDKMKIKNKPIMFSHKRTFRTYNQNAQL
jgi:hypothetical protein